MNQRTIILFKRKLNQINYPCQIDLNLSESAGFDWFGPFGLLFNFSAEAHSKVLAKPIGLIAVSFGVTLSFVLLSTKSIFKKFRSHGLKLRVVAPWAGRFGPANEPIKTLFTSLEFRNTKWSFLSAPFNPVTSNYGAIMPSWFDIHEIPVTADSPEDEGGVLRAVQNVHALIDKEIAAGTNPNNVFVCGFSRGVFSGWVPFNSSILERVAPDAKKAYPGLGHSISHEELLSLESWIKSHLQSSS